MAEKYTEGAYWHDAVMHEYDLAFTRDNITIEMGANLVDEPIKQLTLLGKKTSNGKYVPLKPGASDGSQLVAGILYTDNVDASSIDKKVIALVRGPAVVIIGKCIVPTLTALQLVDLKSRLADVLRIKGV
jgi:hypothetical protein